MKKYLLGMFAAALMSTGMVATAASTASASPYPGTIGDHVPHPQRRCRARRPPGARSARGVHQRQRSAARPCRTFTFTRHDGKRTYQFTRYYSQPTIYSFHHMAGGQVPRDRALRLAPGQLGVQELQRLRTTSRFAADDLCTALDRPLARTRGGAEAAFPDRIAPVLNRTTALWCAPDHSGRSSAVAYTALAGLAGPGRPAATPRPAPTQLQRGPRRPGPPPHATRPSTACAGPRPRRPTAPTAPGGAR